MSDKPTHTKPTHTFHLIHHGSPDAMDGAAAEVNVTVPAHEVSLVKDVLLATFAIIWDVNVANIQVMTDEEMEAAPRCATCGLLVHPPNPECRADKVWVKEATSRLVDLTKVEAASVSAVRDCKNCRHRCMDMDLQPYCSAVNLPWGRALYAGVPAECGDKEFKLWQIDVRRKS